MAARKPLVMGAIGPQEAASGDTVKGTGTAAAAPTDLMMMSDVQALVSVVNAQIGTAYTILASDINKLITFTNSASITVTLPNNLPAGFVCQVAQEGAGQVGFVAASGATLVNRQALYHLNAQYSGGTLAIVSNSGTAAAWRLYGDVA